MESLEKGKATHKRMETRRKKTELSRGCEGRFRKARRHWGRGRK